MKLMELSEKELFVKNSFWNALSVIITKLGGIFFVILLARFLLPEKFGIYSLASTIALFILSLLNTALNQAVTRYVSESLQKNDKKQAGAYFNYIKKLKFLIYLVLTFLSLLLAYPLSIYLFQKPDLFIPLIMFSFYILLLSMQTFYESVFYAIKKVKFLTVKELFLQLIKIIICLTLFSILKASIPVAIFTIFLSSLFTIIILKIYLKKNVLFLFDNSNILKESSRVNTFIKKSTVSSLLTNVSDNIDILILSFFVSSVYIGYFSAAILILGGFFGIMSLSNLSLPLFTNSNELEIKKIFQYIFKYLALISIPLISSIIIFGRYILKFLYGNSYLEATVPLLILSIMLFEYPLTEHLKSFLLSKEKPGIIGKGAFISLIIDIPLNIFLLSIFSNKSPLFLMGIVSLSLIFSRLITMIYLFNYINKNFKISYKPHFLIKPLICSLISFIPFSFINIYIKDMTVLRGLIEILIAGILYIIILILLKGLEKKDFLFFKKILNLK